MPSCANCNGTGSECVYYDPAVAEYVSRKEIHDLQRRLEQLENTRKQTEAKLVSPREFLFLTGKSHLEVTTHLYLGKFTPGNIFIWAMQHCGRQCDIDLSKAEPRYECALTVKFDKAMLTPSITRILVDNYFENINPKFRIFERPFFDFDVQVRNLPSRRCLLVVLALAISSAQYMRKDPNFVPITLLLTQWAQTGIPECVAEYNLDSLTVMVLSCLLQMLHPTGQDLWYTLGLCCRFCLGQGIPKETEDATTFEKTLSVLYDIEEEVALSLGRVPMLQAYNIHQMKLNVSGLHLVSLTVQLFKKIYDRQEQECPYDDDLNHFLQTHMDTLTSDPKSCVLLAFITAHSCSICPPLIAQVVIPLVVVGLMNIIKSAYELIRNENMISCWLETIKVFNAGCTLFTIYQKHLHEAMDFSNIAITEQQILQHLLLAETALDYTSRYWRDGIRYKYAFKSLVQSS